MTWAQSHSRILSFLHSNSHWQWGQVFVIVTALHRTILIQDLAATAGGVESGPKKQDMTNYLFSEGYKISVSMAGLLTYPGF
jgi:hypothetical protein